MDIFDHICQINTRMKDLEMKIDAVILRLQYCERLSSQKLHQRDYCESNLLAQYLNDSSCFPSDVTPKSTEASHQSTNNHTRWMSNQLTKFTSVKVKQKILDSKSFGLIKRSILLNSQEVQQMRQKMIDLQKQFIGRISGVQEGVQILTRLLHITDNRLETILQQKKESQLIDFAKSNKLNAVNQKTQKTQKYSKTSKNQTKMKDLNYLYLSKQTY